MHKIKTFTFILFFIFLFLLPFPFTNFTTIHASETDNTTTNKENCYQLANRILDLILTKNTLNEKEAQIFASAIFELENRIDCLDIIKNNTIIIKTSNQFFSLKNPFIFLHTDNIASPFVNLKHNYYNIIPNIKKINYHNDPDNLLPQIINIKPLLGNTFTIPRTLNLLVIAKNLIIAVPDLSNIRSKKELTNFLIKAEKEKHFDFCYMIYGTPINIPRTNLTSFSTQYIISCPAKHLEKGFDSLKTNSKLFTLHNQKGIIALHIYNTNPDTTESNKNSFSLHELTLTDTDYLNIINKVSQDNLTIKDILLLLKKLPNFSTDENLCFYEDIKQHKENFTTITLHKKSPETTCTEQATQLVNNEFQLMKTLATWILKEILQEKHI